jgi:hypothetical protein
VRVYTHEVVTLWYRSVTGQSASWNWMLIGRKMWL